MAKSPLVVTSFPDPKFIISDPDPQIENQKFGSGSFGELEMVKKEMVNFGSYKDTNEIFNFFKYFKYCVWNYGTFVHFLGLFKNIFLSLKCEKGKDPDPCGQIISDPGGSGSGALIITNNCIDFNRSSKV